jgi:hypothetical protein
MPDDKRAAVADEVVSKMRERGVLGEQDESIAPAPAEEGGTMTDSANATADTDPNDNPESI